MPARRLHRSRSTARVLSLGVLAVLLFSLLQRLSLHTISRVIHPQLFLLPSSALLYPLACIRWLSNAAWRSSPRPPLPEGVDLVDVMVGTGGDTPNGSGGMIPSTAPPFGMTRWVAQTRENYVSSTPYNRTDRFIHGFQGTHQPAIWMGESGQVVIHAGLGLVKTAFRDRGLRFSHADENATISHYSVKMDAGRGRSIKGEHASTSRVGHIKYSFGTNVASSPFIVLQSTRNTIITSNSTNITSVLGGSVQIHPSTREISGVNPERQDSILLSSALPASSFAGYFFARFSEPFESYGVANGARLHPGEKVLGEGEEIAGWARFKKGTKEVEVRIGTSFISVEQARRNLEREIPDGTSIEETAAATREAWREKLGRITFGEDEEEHGVAKVPPRSDKWHRIFYTAFWHSLQYPFETSEEGHYYSGYDNVVHEGESFGGYSNWDTFRAEWPWLILFAPERVPGMITSMLNDYREGGWLPMWKNIVETNIMIGTHADSMIASAISRNVTGWNRTLALEAVLKNANVAPELDMTTQYADREENVCYEVRAGLDSFYRTKGYVADDLHTESASRTLAYAYDDHAVSLVCAAMGDEVGARKYANRSQNYRSIWNKKRGFMEARLANGSWAGKKEGWTEGDQWAYSFDVVHDIPGLIDLTGGTKAFVDFLDRHFDGGHNDHTNEPSHHIPYLYSMAGAPSRSAERVRQVALEEGNYGLGPEGLLGNEDCGQMSAWFLFSALGFYPVNPAGEEYIVATPLFPSITVRLPSPPHNASSSAPRLPDRVLRILAPGAGTYREVKPYIRSLSINGRNVDRPVIRHEEIFSTDGRDVEMLFEMSDRPTRWGRR